MSAPRYIVETAKIPAAEFFADDIFLVDFGESFPFDNPPKPENIGVPFMYRAPEAIFASQYDQRSAIWSLACVLFEIRGRHPLFTSVMGGKDEIIQQMVQTKGRLPGPWWDQWEKRTRFFDDDGKPLKIWPDGRVLAMQYPLKEMIQDIGSEDEDHAVVSGPAGQLLEPSETRVPSQEAVAMEDLLGRMLQWNPCERLPVQEVLRHPWISEQVPK